MSTQTTLPATSRTSRRPKRAILLLVLVLIAISACVFTTLCTRKKLEKLKSQFESESARILESNKLTQKAQEDQWKLIYNELKTLKEKNDRLEEQNERLSDELFKQNDKITMLEAKNFDLSKYEKLIHGSMQKSDFALYNDIYLETFRGLLPIAESLENLSNQIASSNPNLESLELLENLKAAHHEYTNVLNNGQEIIKEALKDETIEASSEAEHLAGGKDNVTNEGIKEEGTYNVINDCKDVYEPIDDSIYHYQNETIIPDPFDDEDNRKDSRKKSDEVFSGFKKRIQEDLRALGALAKEALENAKGKAEDISEKVVEKSKNMGEKVSEAGKAFGEKSGNFAKKGLDFVVETGKKIEDVAGQTFGAAKEKMGKASEDLGRKVQEASEKVRKVLSDDRLVEARSNIAQKTSEVVGKIRKGLGKLFG